MRPGFVFYDYSYISTIGCLTVSTYDNSIMKLFGFYMSEKNRNHRVNRIICLKNRMVRMVGVSKAIYSYSQNSKLMATFTITIEDIA